MAICGPELMAAFENQVADDKAMSFRGTARIRFEHLTFPSPIRLFNKRIVASLKRDFAVAGCLKHELDYRIPAIIDDQILEAALGILGMDKDTFRAYSSHHPRELKLDHGVRLECLHGRHRIVAAAESLLSPDQWWTVDLYGTGLAISVYYRNVADSFTGLADKTKQRLREGYTYSINYTDGEIFRQIRLSQFQNDIIGESRWRARLTRSKARDLKTLLKRKRLVNSLDSILAIRGLWSAFKLGSMDVFSTLRCDEVCYPLRPPCSW